MLMLKTSLIWYLTVLVFLGGCAATVPMPEPPPLEAEWGSGLALPAEIRQALDQSSLSSMESPDGTKVPVRMFGLDGSATPVIMVHGQQSHSGWFVQSAVYLASLGHPVYSIDRRGSGLSRLPRGDSKDFHEWSDDIYAVVQRVNLRHEHAQVLVVGHCFGAIPAIVFAQEYPHLVKALIFTTPEIFTLTGITASQTTKIIFSGSGSRDYYFPAPLDPTLFSDLSEYENFIAADPLGLTAVTGDFYWQTLRARNYLQGRGERLTMPLFVGFAGEEDPVADNARTRVWLNRLPSQFKTEMRYPDSRHVLEFSREKDAFFADLRRWLAWVEER